MLTLITRPRISVGARSCATVLKPDRQARYAAPTPKIAAAASPMVGASA